MILVSPAEPAVLRAIGTQSPIPERYGCDFWMATDDGITVGVQRKEVRDLVASIHNGLLAKELGKMEALDYRVLLVEGNWRWLINGQSGAVAGWSKLQMRGVSFSLQSQGFWLLYTDSREDTIESVSQLAAWIAKGKHSLIRTRPKASSSWGKATNREWAVHLLQSFDGVAVGLAEAIYDHFEGVPLAWTITKDEMMRVKGMGEKRTNTLLEAIPTIMDLED